MDAFHYHQGGFLEFVENGSFLLKLFESSEKDKSISSEKGQKVQLFFPIFKKWSNFLYREFTVLERFPIALTPQKGFLSREQYCFLFVEKCNKLQYLIKKQNERRNDLFEV